MIFFTITAANYYAKAATLAESLRQHHDDATTVLILVENDRDLVPADTPFDQTLLASQVWGQAFNRFVFRHNLLEGLTAIKAQAFFYLLQTHQREDAFVYLDPDVWVMSRMEELLDSMTAQRILLTPHHLLDEPTLEGVRDNVFRTLKCGVFNLGFIGIRRSSEAIAFLRWWHSRLSMLCYVDFERGLFVDQKWIDLAAGMFDISVLREPGYNVANWNISLRPLARSNEGDLLAGGRPLRFFHFSGLDSSKDLRTLLRYGDASDGRSNVALELRDVYKEAIAHNGQSRYSDVPWSYDRYASGEAISWPARLVCRQSERLRESLDDPYLLSNDEILTRSVLRDAGTL